MYRKLSTCIATFAIASVGFISPAPANTQPEQVCAHGYIQNHTPSACCIIEESYSLTAKEHRIPFEGVSIERSDPGGTLTVSRSQSGTVSAEVTAGAQTAIDAVLAEAQVSVSATLAGSQTIVTEATYSHDISPGKFGNAQYVSWGQEVTYEKFRVNHDCTTTVLESGTIIYPDTNRVGWYYWED